MTAPTDDWSLSNGVVTIRPPRDGDAAILIAGRDDEWARWLAPGTDNPDPTACIVVGDEIAGWVDADPAAEGLGEGEVNIGYNVFAAHRGKGYATRAVLLLLRHLASDGVYETAVVRTRRGNAASLRVAEKAGFAVTGESADEVRLARRV